jgi:hypothetical protein
MDSLAANPSGSSIYGYGGSSGPNLNDAFSMYNRIKERDMNDFMKKANFMADLSLRQNRLQSLFNPDGGKDIQGNAPNVVLANQMTPYQQGELGIRKQQLGLEGQKISQAGKIGEERIGQLEQKHQLDVTKQQNIHETKVADMQRKIEEANNKLGLAYDQLNSKNTNAASQLQAHKDIAAAMEERHKLEMAHKDLLFEKSKSDHEDAMKMMQQRLDQESETSTTTEINPEGTKKTANTQKGKSKSTDNDPLGIRPDKKE